MKRYKERKCLVAAVIFWFSCIGLCIASDEIGCVTSQCHSSMSEGQNIHPAGKECVTCHLQKAVEHPGQAKNAFTLQRVGICIECHEIEERAVTHPPVAAEDCLICHDPHGSILGKFLKQEGIKLCLGCHRDTIEQQATMLHGPIANGSCIACHDPHGADYNKLFPKNYSLKLFESYTDNKYDLCFSCHSSNLLRFPDTSFSTGFRDGNRNLHFLHVNKKVRGKNCKLCHEIHAGSQPFLMAEKVPFGTWQLPLHFEKTENGGTCSPGCHKPASYDRTKKIEFESK